MFLIIARMSKVHIKKPSEFTAAQLVHFFKTATHNKDKENQIIFFFKNLTVIKLFYTAGSL